MPPTSRIAASLALILSLSGGVLAHDENSLLSIPEGIATPFPEPSASEPAEPAPAGPDATLLAPTNVDAAAEEPGDEALKRELKPVLDLRVDITTPPGKLPQDYAARRRELRPAPAGQVLLRTWPVMAYHWTAPGSRHYPLYFEEVNAERYGYTCSRCLQPAVSAAHFFGTIPALPYLMAADCPRECVYTLGHYRPGNCNPWRRHCWPCSVSGAALEGAAVYGLIVVIP